MSIKIDKSMFTPEELRAYQALIAKATVEEEDFREEKEFEIPAKKKRPVEYEVEREYVDEEDEVEKEELTAEFAEEEMDKSRCKKSVSPEIAKALNRLDKLEKSLAMNEFTEIAKKYAPLGEDEAELAQTLYDMKKSSPSNYDAYIEVLDKSLGLIEKSGIFAEIGKSGSAYGAAGGTVGKIDTIASEIRKSNPEMTYEQSIAKAWENNPELIAEYDKEYRK